MEPPPGLDVDFSTPPGAAALIPADSVSWHIFANPVALFIGGVAAVILELAEPSVRAGVWNHSSFRKDPLMRLRRTGMAAMITVYAPRAEAEAMIAKVGRMHEQVRGVLADGTPYHANDVRLLDWVQATASFGFIEAYHHYARNLSDAERDGAYAEGAVAAHLYGATGAPQSRAEWQSLFDKMLPALESSPILDEFLDIMRNKPLLPAGLRHSQPLLVNAAIAILPSAALKILRLEDAVPGVAARKAIKTMGFVAEHIKLPDSPYAQSRARMQYLAP